MNIIVTTAPTEAEKLALLSVAELKANMRITHSVEDAIFKWCILAAYDWLGNAEYGWLNRTILTTEFTGYLPGWMKEQTVSVQATGGPGVIWVPTTTIEIPRPPLRSIDGITYKVGGNPLALDSSQYNFSTSGLFGKVNRATNVIWPTGLDVSDEAVAIDFTAGFGDGPTVKAKYSGIVQAMFLLAGDAYRNREDTYAEPRLVAVNRQIINGVARYAGRYRIVNAHA